MSKKNKKIFNIGVTSILILSYVFLFFKRVIYPDDSFDTLNYHFFLGKNGFENFPFAFKPSEFFPLGMHGFNPLIDMIGYVSYLIFGYRIGTIFSLLSFVGASVIGVQLLKKATINKFKIVGVFLIFPAFIVNEGIFQIGTYFTDNIYTFFLVSYVFILFKLIEAESIKLKYILIFFLSILMGLIITKLTNVIYAIPLFFVTLYYMYKKNQDNNLVNIKNLAIQLILYGIIVVSLNSFMFVSFHQTGNPVFPYYNKIFKSEYYPQSSWHFNFGPITTMEKLFYPYYAISNPQILGEVKDLFPDTKLIVEFLFVLSVFAFLLFKKQKFNKYEATLLFIFLSSFFLWQTQFGYSRYAIFLEMLGGILSIIFIQKVFCKKNNWIFLKLIVVIYIVYLIFQTGKILNFNYKYDISWRPTVSFGEWSRVFFSSDIFDKYTSVDEKIKDDFKDVDVIIQCLNPSSAYFSTIKELKDLPMLNFDKGYNGDMTTKINYKTKRDLNALRSKNASELNFAVVFNKNHAFSGKENEMCLRALSYDDKIIVSKELEIDNFIGNKSETLMVLVGSYNINN